MAKPLMAVILVVLVLALGGYAYYRIQNLVEIKNKYEAVKQELTERVAEIAALESLVAALEAENVRLSEASGEKRDPRAVVEDMDGERRTLLRRMLR